MTKRKYTAADIEQLLKLIENLNIESLDTPIAVDGDIKEATIGDFVKDDGPTPDDIVIVKETAKILIAAVEKLSPRQQRIIKLRFGLETRNPMTLEEVGQMYGVTRERIRQIELKALNKLRWILITKYKIKEGDLR